MAMIQQYAQDNMRNSIENEGDGYKIGYNVRLQQLIFKIIVPNIRQTMSSLKYGHLYTNIQHRHQQTRLPINQLVDKELKDQQQQIKGDQSLQIVNPQLTLYQLLESLDSQKSINVGNYNHYRKTISIDLSQNKIKDNHMNMSKNKSNSNSSSSIDHNVMKKQLDCQHYCHEQQQEHSQSDSESVEEQSLIQIALENKTLQLQLQALLEQLSKQSSITQQIIQNLTHNNEILTSLRKSYEMQKQKIIQIDNSIYQQQARRKRTKTLTYNGSMNANISMNALPGYKIQAPHVGEIHSIRNEKAKQTNVGLNDRNLQYVNNGYKIQYSYDRNTSVNKGVTQNNSLRFTQNNSLKLSENRYSTKQTQNSCKNNFSYHSATHTTTNISNRQQYKVSQWNPQSQPIPTSTSTWPHNPKQPTKRLSIQDLIDEKQNISHRQLNEQMLVYNNNNYSHKYGHYDHYDRHDCGNAGKFVYNSHKCESTLDSFEDLWRNEKSLNTNGNTNGKDRNKGVYKKVAPTPIWNNNNFLQQNKASLRRRLSQKPQNQPQPQKLATPLKNKTLTAHFFNAKTPTTTETPQQKQRNSRKAIFDNANHLGNKYTQNKVYQFGKGIKNYNGRTKEMGKDCEKESGRKAEQQVRIDVRGLNYR